MVEHEHQPAIGSEQTSSPDLKLADLLAEIGLELTDAEAQTVACFDELGLGSKYLEDQNHILAHGQPPHRRQELNGRVFEYLAYAQLSIDPRFRGLRLLSPYATQRALAKAYPQVAKVWQRQPESQEAFSVYIHENGRNSTLLFEPDGLALDNKQLSYLIEYKSMHATVNEGQMYRIKDFLELIKARRGRNLRLALAHSLGLDSITTDETKILYVLGSPRKQVVLDNIGRIIQCLGDEVVLMPSPLRARTVYAIRKCLLKVANKERGSG